MSQPTSTFISTQKLATGQVPTSGDISKTLEELSYPLHEQRGKEGKEGKIAAHAEKLIQDTKSIFEDKRPEENFEKIQQHSKEINQVMIEISKQKDVHEFWGEEQFTELRELVDSFRSTCISLVRNKKLRTEFMETLHTFQLVIADLTRVVTEKKESSEPSQYHKEEFTSVFPHQKLLDPSLEQRYREYHQHEVTSHLERSRTDIQQKLRRLLTELGKNQEYKTFIQKLFLFTQHNNKRLQYVYSHGNEKYQQPFKLLFDDIQELVEKFTGGKSLSPLRKRVGKVWESIRNDREISQFFGNFREVITATLQEPEKQDTYKLDQQMNSFYERARFILSKKNLREDWIYILSEFRHVLKRFREDTHVRSISSDVKGLRKELILNKQGEVDLQVLKESLPLLRNVLVPTLTTSINQIPIPSIKSDTDKYFFEASNVNFAVTDLLPETLKIKLNNLVWFDFSGVGMDRLDSVLAVSLRDFQAHLQNVNFHYERKTMPAITDSGIVDVNISDTSIKLRWKIEYTDGKLEFVLDKVRCRMEELDITVKKAGHSFLDKLVVRFFCNNIKNRIVQSIEETLREKLGKITINTTHDFGQIQQAQ
jgi:hypothetical protein